MCLLRINKKRGGWRRRADASNTSSVPGTPLTAQANEDRSASALMTQTNEDGPGSGSHPSVYRPPALKDKVNANRGMQQAPQTKDQSHKSLWDLAYEDLRNQKDGPKLIERFEKILNDQSKTKQTTITLGNEDTATKEDQMSALVNKQLKNMNEEKWRIKLIGKVVEVREQVDRVVSVVRAVKEFISPFAGIDPIHAGLPLAGLLVNDSQERADAIYGLEYITELVRRFAAIEYIYLQDEECTYKEELEVVVIKLYSQILEYETRAACQFDRNTALQVARNVFKADDWKEILEKIKESEEACDKRIRTIDAGDQRTRAKRLENTLEKQNCDILTQLKLSQIQYGELLKTIQEGQKEQEEWVKAKDEMDCLKVFRTSTYEDTMEKNPDHVPGTCEWFVRHSRYREWLNGPASNLLWVTADPGCGKSVLSKFLINSYKSERQKDTSNTSICYFFFKDDSDENKSAAHALCAILHQLFEQNPALLKHAMPHYKRNDGMLCQLLQILWEILMDAAVDPNNGNIVCVIDALDECAESSCGTLINCLAKFYSTVMNTATRIKFLITSRQNPFLEQVFTERFQDPASLRLMGENESEMEEICVEINLVIEAKVKEFQELRLKYGIHDDAHIAVQKQLKGIENRTYLWVALILPELRKMAKYPEHKLLKTIKNIPSSVSEAYERILENSYDKDMARKLLQIVCTAIRPLTLVEMNWALSINEDDSVAELFPLQSFPGIVRDICGLFISIQHSKIYLIHQTAKEFLICENVKESTNSTGDCWKHFLKPAESNLVLAKICISYLLQPEFENDPLIVDGKLEYKKAKTCTEEYANKHGFLLYSAEHWATHFREAEIKEIETCSSVMDLYDIQSKRFVTWFQVYRMAAVGWYYGFPHNFTDLIVGSYFGHEVIVKLLLMRPTELEYKDDFGNTPLLWAVQKKHEAVVKLLLEKSANPESKDKFGQTPLLWATKKRYETVVKLLLKKGANLESKNGDYGGTPLSAAAECGHEAVVRLLLEKGANPESKDEFGQTPLSWAARNGQKRVVKLLLEKNVNLESKDESSRTPLSWAAGYGYKTVVKLLLEKGANPESKDESGRTPLLWIAGAIDLEIDEDIWITEKERENTVKFLLEKGANPESKDESGRTPLSWAAEYGYKTAVKLLLEKSANLESKDNFGRTPLSYAAEKGQERIVKFLLEKSANPESKDKFDKTPLSWAAQKGYETVVKLLLEKGANLESKDNYNETPLSWAAKYGHETVVKLLLEKGANLEFKNEFGRTPLSQAAQKGHEAVVKLLLEKGANLESKDESGRTPLSRAAEEGCEAVVKLLLEKGANLESKDNYNETPLSWAAKYGHETVVKLLLEKSANPESKSGFGQTPLSWAAEKGYETVVKLLLEKGANLESKDDNYSGIPLSAAAECGHEAVVRLLLEKGANLEFKDEFGRTPLSWAAGYGHEAVVRLLLEKGANLEFKNKFGRTPLSWAAGYGHEAVVRLLLEKGANIESKDNFGRTPLSWAAGYGHEAVIKLFLQKGAKLEADSGRTPLSRAIEKGHEEIVKLLTPTPDS
ncbi:MAG: hypothetical protein M1834_005581 [Cirrosporium novae-zelandiae]|nr:MAG: hypothetical protein M1834_005581 [Cirrosporium novae-zelandiae]